MAIFNSYVKLPEGIWDFHGPSMPKTHVFRPRLSRRALAAARCRRENSDRWTGTAGIGGDGHVVIR
jgi:hypothetical protein